MRKAIEREVHFKEAIIWGYFAQVCSVASVDRSLRQEQQGRGGGSRGEAREGRARHPFSFMTVTPGIGVCTD